MEWAPAALAAVVAVGVAASVLPTPSLVLVAAFLLRTLLVRPTVHERTSPIQPLCARALALTRFARALRATAKPVPKLVDADASTGSASLSDAERRQRVRKPPDRAHVQARRSRALAR